MAELRLSAAAHTDIVEVLAWTHEQFGEQARLRYEHLLAAALKDIAVEPERAGSVDRPELGPHVRSYHLRHSRARAGHKGRVIRRPRHFLLYRLAHPGLIGVGRVLHDAMDVERHLQDDYGDE